MLENCEQHGQLCISANQLSDRNGSPLTLYTCPGCVCGFIWKEDMLAPHLILDFLVTFVLCALHSPGKTGVYKVTLQSPCLPPLQKQWTRASTNGQTWPKKTISLICSFWKNTVNTLPGPKLAIHFQETVMLGQLFGTLVPNHRRNTLTWNGGAC